MKNVLLTKIAAAAAAEAAVAANEAKVQSIFGEASLFKWPELWPLSKRVLESHQLNEHGATEHLS